MAVLELGYHILKLLGLRSDKSGGWFGGVDARPDSRFIGHNLKVVDDVVLVREGGRNGWKRVDLVEANFIVPYGPGATSPLYVLAGWRVLPLQVRWKVDRKDESPAE